MTPASSDHPTVLVTAATGTVGRHVVRELVDREVAVRAGSRNPATAGEGLDDDAVAVEFDFERPETWGRALEGVDATFLVRPPGVDRTSLTGFVDAAARVGVGRVVYLSTLGAEKNVLIPHHRIERHVAASGMEYAFVRASFFLQNLHEVHARDIVERDEIFLPAGSGETSFVDARDVGGAAAVLLAGGGEPGAAYDVTGPEALGYDEVAAVFSDVLGREITYANPSVPEFLARELSRGTPPVFALLQVGIYTTARVGLAGRVSDDGERLLGRPLRGVREYVEDYAEEFQSGSAGRPPGT